LSQAANTFWDDRIERVDAAAKASPLVKRRERARRLVDGIILTIILAAAATCVSVYRRGRAELGAAMAKHQVAGEKVEDLTIKIEKLEREVVQLRTDPMVIELFARQRFGLVRAGDVVIKISQEGDGATTERDARAITDARGVSDVGGVSGARAGSEVRRVSDGQGLSNSRAASGVGPASGVGAARVSNLTARTGEVYTDASN
jgi:cell division protein FtsB